MTIQELIQYLQEIAEQYGNETEVRLAIQPDYPFQHTIDTIVAVDLNAAEEDEGDEDYDGEPQWNTVNETEPQMIVYIAEGGQFRDAPYLPGQARRELGWGGR